MVGNTRKVLFALGAAIREGFDKGRRWRNYNLELNGLICALHSKPKTMGLFRTGFFQRDREVCLRAGHAGICTLGKRGRLLATHRNDAVADYEPAPIRRAILADVHHQNRTLPIRQTACC
jgi:hypothetical protein